MLAPQRQRVRLRLSTFLLRRGLEELLERGPKRPVQQPRLPHRFKVGDDYVWRWQALRPGLHYLQNCRSAQVMAGPVPRLALPAKLSLGSGDGGNDRSSHREHTGSAVSRALLAAAGPALPAKLSLGSGNGSTSTGARIVSTLAAQCCERFRRRQALRLGLHATMQRKHRAMQTLCNANTAQCEHSATQTPCNANTVQRKHSAMPTPCTANTVQRKHCAMQNHHALWIQGKAQKRTLELGLRER